MAKRGFIRQNLPPTQRQIEFAEKLRIQVNSDMTRGQVSDSIDAVLRACENAREAERLQIDLDALNELCKKGCIPGAVVQAWNWSHLIVRSLNSDRGEIVCFSREGRGKRHTLRARVVKFVETTKTFWNQEELDGYSPSVGFAMLTPAEAKAVFSGGDEKLISEVIIRDSFFSRQRQYFLPEDDYQSAIAEARIRRAEKKVAEKSAHRAAIDRKFCSVCGTEMHRPENTAIGTWGKVRRCESHRDTVQSQGDFKHCIRCWAKFQPRSPNSFLCPSSHK